MSSIQKPGATAGGVRTVSSTGTVPPGPIINVSRPSVQARISRPPESTSTSHRPVVQTVSRKLTSWSLPARKVPIGQTRVVSVNTEGSTHSQSKPPPMPTTAKAGPVASSSNGQSADTGNGDPSLGQGVRTCVLCKRYPKISNFGGVPLLLPCLHTVCSQRCLNVCYEEGSPTNACPVCRAKFRFDEIEPHEFLWSELLNTRPKLKSVRVCERCTSQNIYSAKYCLECDMMICSPCLALHEDEAAESHRHTYTSMEKGSQLRLSKEQGEEESRPKPTKCSLHKKYQDFYCKNCDVAICSECRLRHEEHTIKTIEEEDQVYRSDLQHKVNEQREQMLRAKECHEHIENRIPRIMAEEKLGLVREAKQRLVYFMQLLVHEEIEARKTIAQSTIYKAKEFNLKRAAVEAYMQQSQQFIDFVESMQKSITPIVDRCNKEALACQSEKLNKMSKNWKEDESFNKWTESGMKFRMYPNLAQEKDAYEKNMRKYFSIYYNLEKHEVPSPTVKKQASLSKGTPSTTVIGDRETGRDAKPPTTDAAFKDVPKTSICSQTKKTDVETGEISSATEKIEEPEVTIVEMPVASTSAEKEEVECSPEKKTAKYCAQPIDDKVDKLKPASDKSSGTALASNSSVKNASPVSSISKPVEQGTSESPTTSASLVGNSQPTFKAHSNNKQSDSLATKSVKPEDMSPTKNSAEIISDNITHKSPTKNVTTIVLSPESRVTRQRLAMGGTAGLLKGNVIGPSGDVPRVVQTTPVPERKESKEKDKIAATSSCSNDSKVKRNTDASNESNKVLYNTPIMNENMKEEVKAEVKVEAKPSTEQIITPRRIGLRSSIRGNSETNKASSSGNSRPEKRQHSETNASVIDTKKSEGLAKTTAEPSKSNRNVVTKSPLVVEPSTRVLRRDSKVDAGSTTSSDADVKDIKDVKHVGLNDAPTEGLKLKINVSPTTQKSHGLPPVSPATSDSSSSSRPKRKSTQLVTPPLPPPPPKRNRDRASCSETSAQKRQITVAAPDVKPNPAIQSQGTSARPTQTNRPSAESSGSRRKNRNRRKDRRVTPNAISGVGVQGLHCLPPFLDDGQMKISDDPNDRNEDYCAVCRDGGNDVLICCDGCPKVFHTNCHLPVVAGIPEDNWQCNICKPKEQLLEEWSLVPNLQTARCDGNQPSKCGSRKVDVYKIQNCGLTKHEFIVACKLLCTIYQFENSKVLSVHFERYFTQNNFPGEPHHLNAIRMRLTQGSPVPIDKVEDLVSLIRKMFEQGKELYKELEFYLKVVLELEANFNEILPQYFPNLNAAV